MLNDCVMNITIQTKILCKYMRTIKHKKVKNRTVKGGKNPTTTKVYFSVKKSAVDNNNLIPNIFLQKPIFPFITSIWYSMNAVDEALALIRPQQIPEKSITGETNEGSNIIYNKKIFEYGYNQIE